MPSSTSPLSTVVDFLGGLKQQNHKPWFEQHRSDYDAARAAFAVLVEAVIDEFRATDQLGDLTPQACISRIYRDVRFSRDKTPYKTNFGALIGPHGWKTAWRGYYVSIEPGGLSMTGGGLYSPTPPQLEKYRKAIDHDPAAFLRVTQARDFVKVFGPVAGERLKTAPKGYAREHPALEWLQLKQIYVMHRFTDREVLSPRFAAQVIEVCHQMRPFLAFLQATVG